MRLEAGPARAGIRTPLTETRPRLPNGHNFGALLVKSRSRRRAVEDVEIPTGFSKGIGRRRETASPFSMAFHDAQMPTPAKPLAQRKRMHEY